MREDQAQGLRRLFAPRTCRLAAVCGSQGTAVAVALAGALARMGYRISILDRSVGEAARAIGRRARYDLAHVLDGDCTLAQAMLAGPEHVHVLPAARGLDRLAAESNDWQAALQARLPALADADLWLVNGLLPGPAPDAPMLLAIGPSTSSVTNAYGQIKALARAQGRRRFAVVVHAVPSAAAAERVFGCIADTARRFLAAELDLLGWVPPSVVAETGEVNLGTGSTAAFDRIADRLMTDLSTPPLLRTGS